MKEETLFNSQAEVLKLLTDPKKHIQIIGLYALEKGYLFANKDQMQWFIRRNTRTARRLECFELKKIRSTLLHLLASADYKVGLETIEKYIMEDVEELRGEDPIITMSTGEKIYDIERLIQLETEGQIYYDGKIWREGNSRTPIVHNRVNTSPAPQPSQSHDVE